VGAVHAIYVGYVTVGETFGITVPLYVVLMSVLGGMRHWLGPAVGAALIGASLFAFTSGDLAIAGRAIVALALIVVILLLPDGVVPSLLRFAQRWRQPRAPARPVTPAVSVPAAAAVPRATAGAGKLLECIEVRKAFGGIQALRGVTLGVREGEILGLVGPNGSGKTTLINVVSGHYRLDSGSIDLAGKSIAGLPAHRIAALGIARTYQIPRPFAHLTALQNVVLAAIFGPAQRDRDDLHGEALHWLEFTGLAHRADRLPADLNLHERKFLELARALAARPRILMLDEVLSGLNPAEVDSAIRLIRAIHAQGATIVFIEHLMRAVVELSDRVAVMNEGAVLALGAPREVMKDPRVVTAYLGTAYAA
jgi:branched-chain amino acid transport system permease protein